MDFARHIDSFLVKAEKIYKDDCVRLLHLLQKMNVFHVRRIENRTYVRRGKTDEESDNYGRSKSVDMKIHVQQMRDDMPSAINEATPCPLVDDLLVVNEFEAGQPSKERDLICYEKRIWHSKHLQVLSMLITSLYVKLETRSCRSSNLN